MEVRMRTPKYHAISKGYVYLNGIRIYTEGVFMPNCKLLIKMFAPKNVVICGADICDYITNGAHIFVCVVPFYSPREVCSDIDGIIDRALQGMRAIRCSDARYKLTMRMASCALYEWETGDKLSAEDLELECRCDISDIPIEAYRTYIKELNDEYYARCFAMQLCELDGYAGQPIVTGNVIVWGQNPAQNV